MADYPTLAATLAALNSTKNDPQGTEAANKLDDSIRQTRIWLYDFLSTLIDPGTNKLKSDAFVSGSLPTNSIRGTNPVDSQPRELVQGTVWTLDLADDAVTSAKIADGTIVAGNIATNTITGDKLADGTIGLAKLADQIIGTASIVNGAVTTEKLADSVVTNSKLGLDAVTGEKVQSFSIPANKLVAATEGTILVGGNGPGGNEFAAKTMNGAVIIDKDGLTRFASDFDAGQLGFAEVAEVAAAGEHGSPFGSGPTVKEWLPRGVTPGHVWNPITLSRTMVTVSEEKIYFVEDGVYLITASAPAYQTKTHKLRLKVIADGGIPGNVLYYYGNSGFSGGGVNQMDRISVTALIKVSSSIPDSGTARPWIVLEHWIKAKNSNDKAWGVSQIGDGDGDSVGDGFAEKYASVQLLKLA